MRYKDKKFGAGIVDLDGHEFVGCAFNGTTLRYSGGEPPCLDGCAFRNVRFVMDGAASRTLALLKAMAAPGSGMQAVVRETFGAMFAN